MATKTGTITNTSKYSKERLQDFYNYFLLKYPDARINRENFKELSKSLLVDTNTADTKNDDEITERLFALFDSDSSGYIDFQEFFAIFSLKSYGTLKEKLEFLFELYDFDKSNYLSFYEIHSIVKILFKLKSYNDELIDFKNDIYSTKSKSLLTPSYYVSIDIMKKFDIDRNAKLSKEEFVQV